jgi:hypothetical protein
MAIKVYIQKRPSIVVQVGAKVINTGGGGVDSVNGQTGVVVLDASDLNAYPDNNPAGYVNAYGAAAAAPVQSVNGNTGAVVLTATDVGAPSGSGTSTGSNTGDQDLSGLQLKSIVVAGNITAVNDGNYTNVASATYTDPSPVEGKGFRVMVRNGTATVGGTAYSTPGTVILRIFHSGSWANYVYQVAGERRHDFTTPYSYMAYAPKGSADSASVWTITRINVAPDGSTTKGTATGAWTNRASLIYI